MRATRIISQFREVISNCAFLWSRCAVCARPRPGEGMLCSACAEELAPRRAGFCPGCGEIFENAELEPHLCGECERSGPPWEDFLFHGRYEGLLRRLIVEYKFHQGLGHGALLQELVCRALRMHLSGPLPELIAPVPLHPSRLRWRGYNQSLELVRRLSRETGMPIESRALARIRRTEPQTSLDRARRLVNLRGAFSADETIVSGRRVLIADDVMTTGTTLQECTRELVKAGAAGVSVIVLAR
jgi:ComF family protein